MILKFVTPFDIIKAVLEIARVKLRLPVLLLRTAVSRLSLAPEKKTKVKFQGFAEY